MCSQASRGNQLNEYALYKTANSHVNKEKKYILIGQ